ncbi:MAG: tyrosine-type recombinase/integrase, partial [Bacteroidota bacterium]
AVEYLERGIRQVPAHISLQWLAQIDLGPDEFLFPGTRQPTLGKNTMYERNKKFLRRMNYGSEYSLYSWRHTGAVAVAKAGASLKELQIQMRHHSISQTDEYLRQLGVQDVVTLKKIHPNIMSIMKKKNQVA